MTGVRLFLAGCACAVLAVGQTAFFYPPRLPDAKVETYKAVGTAKLNLYIFSPPAIGSKAPRAAIVFFFSGGWAMGSPAQFATQCRRLASLGIVAITADYRVSDRNHSTIADSDRDAKSAIRYVRRNAARLSIDPLRIAAAGGSAGGQLAAFTGLMDVLDEPGEDLTVSSRSNALVLFNPVLLLAPVANSWELTRYALVRFWMHPGFWIRSGSVGVETGSLSPFHHIGKNAPPTVIFHGKADQTIPYIVAEAFQRRMLEFGNRCELFGFEGQGHEFFNYGVSQNLYHDETLALTEHFLASLGYLPRHPVASGK